ncbi:hypothetical protein P7K49_004223, partial [Saguinus oedipus]
ALRPDRAFLSLPGRTPGLPPVATRASCDGRLGTAGTLGAGAERRRHGASARARRKTGGGACVMTSRDG